MQNLIYHKLNNSTVRDLYWLLFSDSPLSDAYDLSPFALFPQSILNEWKLSSEDYFLELDKNPNPITRFVDRKKNKRLGFYAEALLSYFFQTFNSVELLLQNFQIIEDQKTLGEVDFIILYKGKVIHLECAVKYYLLKDSKHRTEAAQWVGPRINDNLALKLGRVVNHQLPLGSKKEVQEKINRTIDVSYLFLKGIFFAEAEIDMRINGSSNIYRGQPNQLIRHSELRDFSIKPVEILTRPNWLSATCPTSEQKNEPIQLDQPLTNPEMVLFEDKKVRFVVTDDWGKA